MKRVTDLRYSQELTELKNLKLLAGIFTFTIISAIIMPQYFGVHIGYDITCSRLANILFVMYMLLNPPILTHFLRTIVRCEIWVPLCLYVCVAGYTMVFRKDINAFFLVFLEIFTLFMLIYGIRYVVGCKRAIKWIIYCAYFLSCYGLVEFAYGKSIFLQFLATVPTAVIDQYRSGRYRIMGPCGHPLGYGLLLLIFIAIVCIDYEKNEIYLFKRPVLLVLLLLNVFLTGSRSTLGIAIVEMVVIFLLSNRNNIKKTLIGVVVLIIVLGLFILLTYNTSIGQYIMGQIATLIDQVFGTNYAINFGVDITTLENSENYREMLPYIFTLDWLNPIVGRGTRFGGAEINGVYIQSIDNYYVSQYIKYAYPGLITYVAFLLIILVVMIRNLIKTKSVITKVILIGVFFYFFNLWWLDALQTLKFVYIIIAVFYANHLEQKDIKRQSSAKRLRNG